MGGTEIFLEKSVNLKHLTGPKARDFINSVTIYSPRFVVFEVSQVFATGPYPLPKESNLHFHFIALGSI
jgi:hypothetical protein